MPKLLTFEGHNLKLNLDESKFFNILGIYRSYLDILWNYITLFQY